MNQFHELLMQSWTSMMDEQSTVQAFSRQATPGPRLL